MMQLKARIKDDVTLIPTVIVKAALLSTKKRVIKLVKCQENHARVQDIKSNALF